MKLIGITCMKEVVYEQQSDTLYHNYCEAVADVGGIPVIIPCLSDKDVLAQLLDKLDGVILSGGVDIDPSLYGQEDRDCHYVTKDRDDAEKVIFNVCVEKKKPVLGICRGHQFINVMCGGTLFQDLKEIENGTLEHNNGIKHTLKTTPNSILHSWLGETCEVNSYHHQCVNKVGDGLIVTGVSEDGIVEAMEHVSLPIVTVQFHPEKWMENKNMANVLRYWIHSIKE